jgi:hypothetical protein
MTIKYKLGFTIDSETLFGILSKFLPIQDLSVEEVVERPAPERVLTRADLPGLVHSLHKPKRKYKWAPEKRRPPRPMDLKAGINRIIMEVLEKGPATAVSMRPLVQAAAYSPNSVSSRLQNLQENKIVARNGDGAWILTPEGKARLA